MTVERLRASLADRYRIERELGQGGMATVYLAQDLKHNRKVAIKVLKPELAAVLGAERFVQEIQTTAALNHPHILPLFDSGEAGGFLYYVMPFIEGETIREKLNRETQLGIEEAVRITTEVADALDYAHRHGVIHRDIKPENILLHDGRAMVMDFGIALAVSAAAGGRMTETGLSLGTPHYMSPEQATADKQITARSDVYSLACVLYEMLAGDPPHSGGSAQQIIMKIVTEEAAPVTRMRKAVPPGVAAALAKALEKLPADRFETAKAFADALADPRFTVADVIALGRPAEAHGLRAWIRSPWSWTAMAAVVLLAAGLIAERAAPATTAPVSRFVTELTGFDPTAGVSFAISPDGDYIAFNDDNQLYLRQRDQLEAAPVPGGENGNAPFFSPDGRTLAYATGFPGELRVTPVEGGATTTLVRDSAYAAGGSWSDDGWIYFIGSASRALLRVRAEGGAPQLVARPDSAKDELFFRYPRALPGGRAVLFAIERRRGEADVAVVDVASGKATVLAPGVLAMYAPMGYLIVQQSDGSLQAARFDPRTLKLSRLSTVLDDVWSGSPWSGAAVPGLSNTGTLIYQRFPSDRQVVRVGRDGTEQVVDPGWSGLFDLLSLSPDGSRLAVTLDREGGSEVWVRSLATGTFTRLAYQGVNYRGSWTPDGRSLLFVSARSGHSALYRQPADGSAPATLVRDDPRAVDEGELSADGRWLIYRTGSGGARDLYAVRTERDSTPVPIATSSFEEYAPALSPDGRWVAYVSNESDQPQVYVRPFPDAAAARWQVSRAGGIEPVWSHSGRELFYRNAAGDLVAATIAPGSSFRVASEQPLFSARAYMFDGVSHAYAVSPDDRSFLFVRIPPITGSPLVAVLNWFEEVQAKVGR
jgi:Tol biopolymer transport system component/tRNA A-37 threonylcarbamoyl transferase component Bud32